MLTLLRDSRRSFGIRPQGRILVVAPRKAIAGQMADRLRTAFYRSDGIPVDLVHRPDDFELGEGTGPNVLVTAPHTLIKALRQGLGRVPGLDLVVVEGLEALDPLYELALSRLRYLHPDVRIAASSAALSEAGDLADFLGVPDHGLYSFAPSTRTTPVETNIQPFSTPHSFALLRQMVKPAYDAARTAAGSTIIVVPSRSQCRATASDLVTQSAADLEESFVAEDALDLVMANAEMISDPELSEALVHGIAVFHEGLPPKQQRIALEVFAAGIIRVLVISREACWTLPVRAGNVVVMSAQYVTARDPQAGPGEREVLDYAMPDLLRMQGLAEPATPADASASFFLLCQKDQVDLYQKFLQQGIVVESGLPGSNLLSQVCFDDIVAGQARNRQDLVDALSWTYAARRFGANPSFYSPDLGDVATNADVDPASALLSRLADLQISVLEARCAVLPVGPSGFEVSRLGRLYADLSLALEEVERLQGLALVDLVRAAKPLSNGEIVAKDTEDDPAVSSFWQRLPRAVKNDIGERGEQEREEWARRVLLAAFRAGRIPRHDIGLQEQQVELVKRVVGSRV